MSKVLKNLAERINAIARATEPDYPDIEKVDTFEQLYAIEQGNAGRLAALDDLHAEIRRLKDLLKRLAEAAEPFTSGDTVDETSGTIPLMCTLEDVLEEVEKETL